MNVFLPIQRRRQISPLLPKYYFLHGLEILVVTDLASWTRQRQAFDSFSIVDLISRAVSDRRPTFDSIAISDLAVRGGGQAQNSTDVVSITDLASRLASRPRSISDVVVVIDSAGRVFAKVRTALDSWSDSDIASRAVIGFSRSSHELVAVSDSANRIVDMSRAGIVILESFMQPGTIFTQLGNLIAAGTFIPYESVSIGDHATRSITRTRFGSDAVSIIEHIGDFAGFIRFANDSLTTSGTLSSFALGATYVLGGGGSTYGTSGITDRASSTVSNARMASDSVAMISDTALRPQPYSSQLAQRSSQPGYMFQVGNR